MDGVIDWRPEGAPRYWSPLHHEIPVPRPQGAVVLHRQDPESWRREVMFPTIVISQGKGTEFPWPFREVVLGWQGAQQVCRDLQGLLTGIRERQEWV